MKVTLYDKQKVSFVYTVSEKFIVEPSETWVFDDLGNKRITIITCTDDNTQRQVMIGVMKEKE